MKLGSCRNPLSLLVKGHPQGWGQGCKGARDDSQPWGKVPGPALSTAPGASRVSAPSWITAFGNLCHSDVRMAACRELILGHITGDAQHWTHERFASSALWKANKKPVDLGYKQQWPHSLWPHSTSPVQWLSQVHGLRFTYPDRLFNSS